MIEDDSVTYATSYGFHRHGSTSLVLPRSGLVGYPMSTINTTNTTSTTNER